MSADPPLPSLYASQSSGESFSRTRRSRRSLADDKIEEHKRKLALAAAAADAAMGDGRPSNNRLSSDASAVTLGGASNERSGASYQGEVSRPACARDCDQRPSTCNLVTKRESVTGAMTDRSFSRRQFASGGDRSCRRESVLCAMTDRSFTRRPSASEGGGESRRGSVLGALTDRSFTRRPQGGEAEGGSRRGSSQSSGRRQSGADEAGSRRASTLASERRLSDGMPSINNGSNSDRAKRRPAPLSTPEQSGGGSSVGRQSVTAASMPPASPKVRLSSTSPGMARKCRHSRSSRMDSEPLTEGDESGERESTDVDIPLAEGETLDEATGPPPGVAEGRRTTTGKAPYRMSLGRNLKAKSTWEKAKALYDEEALRSANKAPLSHSVPTWWNPDAAIEDAADSYDHKQGLLSDRVWDALHKLQRNSTSLQAQCRFNTAMFAARANRFNVQPLRMTLTETRRGWGAQQEDHPLRLELVSDQSGPWRVSVEDQIFDDYSGARKRVRRRFKLDSSVWASRKQTGNSKDYFETDEAMRKTFEVDWKLALGAHSLHKFILQAQVQAGTQMGILALTEVAEAKEAVWKHHHVIYGAFDYYSLRDLEQRVDTDGEVIVWGIAFHPFLEFCKDMHWETPKCPSFSYEIIFKHVNAESSAKAADKFNSVLFLSRHEFLQAIVRIAVTRYVMTGEIPDVSDSIEQCCEDMLTWLPPEALQNSNHFRSRYCYTYQVSDVLAAHANSLKQLYATYASANANLSEIASSRLLSLGEWTTLVKHFGLNQLGLRPVDVAYAFTWSRIRSVPDYSNRSQVRLRHLLFEDFMEALVRISTMLALPIDSDLHETGCTHAGEYLTLLRAEGPAAVSSFLEHRQQFWNREPRQRIWRYVAFEALHKQPAEAGSSPPD